MLPWFKTTPAGHSDNAIIFNGKVLAAMPRTRATVRKEARLALLGSNANALRLPQELLEIVVGLVPRRDLPSVRLACHQLLLSASPRIKHIKVDLNGAHGSLVSTARELQRTLCRLPALNSINLSVAADINTHSVKLPAAFTTPLLQLSAITRLEVDGPRHMYSLALPRKVVLPALKAASFNFNITQGSHRNIWLSGIADLASLAPNLQQLYCRSLQIDKPGGHKQQQPQQPQQPHQLQPSHNQQHGQQQQQYLAAVPSMSSSASPGAAAGCAAGPVLQAVTHFGCGVMYLPADTVDEAATRFAGTFPALQVLYETPFTISHTADPNAQEEDDDTAVPLGILLQHLPGLRAVRTNTFENLSWMRSLEGLQHLQHLQQLSLHISVPSYFDIFHFCFIHPIPEGGIPLFHSISKLCGLQRLQLTFELTGAEQDVLNLIHNIAQLPQLESLALPQQLLCSGCYPGLGGKIADQLVHISSLTKLSFLNVNNDRHDNRISTTEVCKKVAERNKKAYQSNGATQQQWHSGHAVLPRQQQQQQQALVFDLDKDQDRWWSCLHNSCSCGRRCSAGSSCITSRGSSAGSSSEEGGRDGNSSSSSPEGDWGVFGPRMSW